MNVSVGYFAIVTDTKRGVMWGRVVAYDMPTRHAILNEARHVYRYRLPEGHRTVYGLASHGPLPKSAGSKISEVLPDGFVVSHVSKICPATEQAIRRFNEVDPI